MFKKVAKDKKTNSIIFQNLLKNLSPFHYCFQQLIEPQDTDFSILF